MQMTDATIDTDLQQYAILLAERARSASHQLALCDSSQKSSWIKRLAALLRSNTASLIEANECDTASAEQHKLSAGQIDRLRLSPARIESMAAGLDQLAQLPDPVGELIEATARPNGLLVHKIRVPMGVIFFIYESRPNVTTDAAVLCVKSGNAVILRGGKEARQSNRAIFALVRESLLESGLPEHSVQLVDRSDRAIVDHLLHLPQLIDLAIPRGGYDLIERVAKEAKMPVMKHYQGICHVYVHERADQEMARRIILNGKCQRPGVCNAVESLLVDRAISHDFLPPTLAQLAEAGVEIRGCSETQALGARVRPATEQDYGTQYLDLKLSVRVVAGLDEAVAHIARFGSGHTDAIITGDERVAAQFARRVDSSAVMINASTRFNDGGELGLGAEIGISTDKYHARGPCGLRELTSYKYVVRGSGQVRGA
jgi:glutamate-5-semialdehyde dehydrogenase